MASTTQSQSSTRGRKGDGNGTAKTTTPAQPEQSKRKRNSSQVQVPALPIKLGISEDGIINLDTNELVEWSVARKLLTVAREAAVNKARVARKAKRLQSLESQKSHAEAWLKSLNEQIAEIAEAVKAGKITFDEGVAATAKATAASNGK